MRDYTKLIELSENLVLRRGTSSSGNWGHGGRPGKKGGSGKGGGHAAIGAKKGDSPQKIKEKANKFRQSGKKKVSDPGNKEGSSLDKDRKRLGQRSEQMAKFENDHAGAKKESAALYDKDGNEIFQVGGKESEVTFSSSQLDSMKGGVLTHNHPSIVNGKKYPDGGSFSESDVQLMVNRDLSEVRAVTENYIYIARPKKVGAANLSRGAIQHSNRVKSSIKEQLDKDYQKGKVKKEDYALEFIHRKWEAVANDGFIEYERIRR